MLPPEQLGEIVNRVALDYDLRPDVVMCVVLQETQGNPFANRFEPLMYDKLSHLKREELSGWKPTAEQVPNIITEKINRAISWGPMQVMGETARWCANFTNPFLPALSEPETGIDCGCKVLSYYMRKHGAYDKALAAYNAGTPLSIAGQSYARQVLTRLKSGEFLKYIQGH